MKEEREWMVNLQNLFQEMYEGGARVDGGSSDAIISLPPGTVQ